ncbi:MAG: crossover junction endodeoxyribonuclease RuvC [Alphaproteobacteria bacterium]|nr:crossover junction endodeoxyribonuclease RuvC [Alphaproteobacteria bacterium]MCY4317684.1 crossover junction endodeoxyribonuclease RuvC [Alphaproteobacteria bacterium]
MTARARVIGFDPGLRITGWGIVEAHGSRLIHVANGELRPDPEAGIADRLAELFASVTQVIEDYGPDMAAIEETFVHRSAGAALKLGMARGAALVASATAGLPVTEYAARSIKKALVGSGGADKAQVQYMIGILLPGCNPAGPDAADALAVAVAHAHGLPFAVAAR